MKQDYKVLIFSPTIIAEGLEKILRQEGGFYVSGIANDRITALKLAKESEADIAIVDTSIHYIGNIEIIDYIKRVNPDLSLLVLSACNEIRYALRCIHAGANGYILMNESREHVIAAIRKVSVGKPYFSSLITEQIANLLPSPSSPKKRLTDVLSNREFELYVLLSQGQTYKEIASKMYISFKTVSNYATRIRKKFGLKSNREMLVHINDINELFSSSKPL